MLKHVVLGLALGCALSRMELQAACGDKITVDGAVIIVPAVVTWDASVDEAMQVALIKKKPFAIYFTSKEDAKIAGESIEAIKAFMKANNNSVPDFLADVPRAVDHARELGIGNFVKIPMTKDNKALVQKYGGETNTLVVCAPSGEKITAFKCDSGGLKNLDGAKKDLAAWAAGSPAATSR